MCAYLSEVCTHFLFKNIRNVRKTSKLGHKLVKYITPIFGRKVYTENERMTERER